MLVLPYRTASFLRASARCVLACLVAVTSVAWLGRACAQENGVVAAANAYAQAQHAELKGDHDRAAELFELADRIAPTPEALRSATRMRLAAGQLALAAGDAEELLIRYESDAPSRELAEQVLAKAKPELTRYTFQCSDPCTVVVDHLAIAVAPQKLQIVYVAPGSHDVELGFADEAVHRVKLTGAAAEARTIKVARPAAPQKQLAKVESTDTREEPIVRKRGLSPGYFWTAGALTVVAGGLTIWSGLDLLNARDDFKASPSPTLKQFHDGEDKDRRTSILIGATSVLAVTTVTLAIFTRFHPQEKRTLASVSFDGHAAQLTLNGKF